MERLGEDQRCRDGPGNECPGFQYVGGPLGDRSRSCHASVNEMKAPTAVITAVRTRKYLVVASIAAPL